MLERLPDLIDPLLLAEKRRILSGKIALEHLSRLSNSLISSTDSVDVSLSFAKQGRLATVQGHIRGCLQLCCQNCLEAIQFPIDISLKLAIVNSLAQADTLAGEYEPLMLEAENIPLADLVEDELLLIIPDFPRHAYSCVNYQALQNNVDSSSEKEANLSNNPFSILAKLKNTGDQ